MKGFTYINHTVGCVKGPEVINTAHGLNTHNERSSLYPNSQIQLKIRLKKTEICNAAIIPFIYIFKQ